MKHRILVLIATLALVAGFAAVRPALAHAQADNTAIAINTKDGGSVFKVAFAIRHVMSDVVDTTNAAVAYASCTDCDTVAIAFEIVLIQDTASTISPENVALSINELCSLCVTVADAYQFVVTTGGNVHFDAEGNRVLAEIRNRLERMKHQELTIAELQAALDEVADQIREVLAKHLVRAGPPPSPRSTPASTQPAATTTPTTPTTTATTPTTTTATTTATTTTTTPGTAEATTTTTTSAETTTTETTGTTTTSP